MFGYILPDKPNLYMKDYALYRAFYCGLCHQIGHCQGQCMRLGVNYDVTFLSILLHGLRQEELTFEKRACILNPFKKKMVVAKGELHRDLALLNALLLDFKCRDDVQDEGRIGKKYLGRLIRRRVNQARRALPEVAQTMDKAFEEQSRVEKENPTSWHLAADPFGICIQQVIRLLAKDTYTPEVGMIGYLLGQYVYLMDAIDDYDVDIKKHRYNPLVGQYNCQNKQELIQYHQQQLQADVAHLVATIKQNYQDVAIFATEGIVTNTLWMGLHSRANEIIKETKKCRKLHTRF